MLSLNVTKKALRPSIFRRQKVKGMATLSAISSRLKSVRNTQKITQSMKMVAAAKYAKADKELKLLLPFGEGSQVFFEAAEVDRPENVKQELLVAITSDKGLCGAVHSSVGRLVRSKLQNSSGTSFMIACIGDKSKAVTQRLFSKSILFSCKELGRSPPIFLEASKIASGILNSGFEFDAGTIIYNKSINAATYKTTEIPIYSLECINSAKKISLYDSLDADVVQSYHEFSLAALIYYAMKENATAEQSARMTAMDNSSRNAGEMIGKLQLMFNRTRQAVITRELIEIISGASAL